MRKKEIEMKEDDAKLKNRERMEWKLADDSLDFE